MRLLTILLTVITLSTLLSAESVEPSPLLVTFAAPEHLRYEVKGEFVVDPQIAGPKKREPNKPCSYRLNSIVDINIAGLQPDKSVVGTAKYQPIQLSEWHCDGASARVRPIIEKDLALLSSPTKFTIRQNGSVHLETSESRGTLPAEAAGVDIIVRTLMDLLQTKISPHPIAIGGPAKSSRAFAYFGSANDDELRYVVASVRYLKDINLADRNCAWLEFNQVWQPVDEIEPPEEHPTEDHNRKTRTSGKSRVTALFDLDTRRMAYVRRNFELLTQINFEYRDRTSEVATVVVQENATARLLPDEKPERWLEAIAEFETPRAPLKPEPEPPAKQSRMVIEDVRQLDMVPEGFRRYTGDYCPREEWGRCINVSFPIPEKATLKPVSDALTLITGTTRGTEITIAVGPYEQSMFPGLTVSERLERESQRLLSNPLWFTGNPAKILTSGSSTITNQNVQLTEFTSVDRESKLVKGTLAMIAVDNRWLLPLVCSHGANAKTDDADLCQTVIDNVRVTH